MSIAILISTETINRLIRQLGEAGALPDIEGRMGRSDLLHACYTVSMPSLPSAGTANEGYLTLQMPLEGMVSIPWGMGVRYYTEAMTDISIEVEGNKLRVKVGDLVLEDLRLGNGCSFPRSFIDLIGPFIHGVLFRGLGVDEQMPIDLPPIEIPLSIVLPGAPPLQMSIKGIGFSHPGMSAFVGLEDDTSPPAPLPPLEGWDLTMAVSERTAEDIAARAMEVIGNIEGNLSVSVPDSKEMADLVFASVETLTTLGRRGLGRRALRSGSTVEVSYAASPGRPSISFGEGEKIILSKIPAHVRAKAELVVEHSAGGFLDRLKSFMLPSRNRAPKVERSPVGSWEIDGDFVLERAEVTVVQKEGSLPKFELTMLDLEMDLPWPLPDEILEKVAEGMGKGMMSSLLPTMITEVPLPPEIPFKLKLENIRVSTSSGKLAIHANIGLVPEGDPQEFKRMLEDRLKMAMPPAYRNVITELTMK